MSDLSPNSGSTAVVSKKETARGELAAWLRHARERSGLSIEAVSQETRISKNYILSLESGNLDGLPGKVFGRGFVKNITRLLRTDTVEGLRLYDACWGHSLVTPTADGPDEQTTKSVSESSTVKSSHVRMIEPRNIATVKSSVVAKDLSVPSQKPRIQASSKKFNSVKLSVKLPEWLVHTFVSPQIRLWILAAFATVFVGLVFGRWAAGTFHKARLSSKPVETTAAMPTDEKASMADDSLEQSAVGAGMTTARVDAVSSGLSTSDGTFVPANESLQKQATIAVKAAEKTDSVATVSESGRSVTADEDNPLYLPSAPGASFEQVLELKVAGDVDIKLTIDGKKIDRTRFAPDTYRFSFNNRAEIYLGDASMVDLIYNGKSLGTLGNKGRKRRIFLQAKATSDDFPQ